MLKELQARRVLTVPCQHVEMVDVAAVFQLAGTLWYTTKFGQLFSTFRRYLFSSFSLPFRADFAGKRLFSFVRLITNTLGESHQYIQV